MPSCLSATGMRVPAVPLVALSSKGLDVILAVVVIVLEIPGLLSHPVLLVQQLVIKSWLHCTCTPHSQPAVTAQR